MAVQHLLVARAEQVTYTALPMHYWYQGISTMNA